jgi:hypothetical protein
MFALILVLPFASAVFAVGLWVSVWIYNLSCRGQSATSEVAEADEFPVMVYTGDTPQKTDAGPYAPPSTIAASPTRAVGIPSPTFIKCVMFGICVAVSHAAIHVVIALSFGLISGWGRSPAQVALLTWLYPWALFGQGFLLGAVLMRFILPTTFGRAVATNLIMYAVFIAVAALFVGPLLLFSN